MLSLLRTGSVASRTLRRRYRVESIASLSTADRRWDDDEGRLRKKGETWRDERSMSPTLLQRSSLRRSVPLRTDPSRSSHGVISSTRTFGQQPLQTRIPSTFMPSLETGPSVYKEETYRRELYSSSIHSHPRFVGSGTIAAALGQPYQIRFPVGAGGSPSIQQVAFFSSKPESGEAKTVPSRKLGTTQVPTPPSAPPAQETTLETLAQTTPKTIVKKGGNLVVSLTKSIGLFLLRLPGNLFYFLTHPAETRQKFVEFKEMIQHEVNHYWVGTKLLWADIQTARGLLNRTLAGSALTRRERKQLLRTVSDLFRLVPFSMFILIPFMEFALPFALRIFPNLLPSTFQDSLKAEETMKRELKSRIAMAQFFQETMEELAKEQKRKAATRKKELVEAGVDPGAEGVETIDEQEDSAASMLEFIEKARNGEMLPQDVIVRYANYFKDDLTLDNMPRMQLINMCKYMSISPYGSDAFLRFQLRHKIRGLKEDDQRILWEGIDSLTKMELREACQERGMRSTGLSKDAYKRLLQQWLDLSVNKNVPISLLIMSRTFFLREEMFERTPDDGAKSLAGLADAISGLDKEILNEVILEVATSQEKLSNPDEAREAAAKKKEDAQAAKEAAEEEASRSEDVPSVEKLQEASETTEKNNTTIVDGEAEVSTTPVSSDEKSADDDTLSPAEMDAISQLLSDDPVSKEREELARIKAAMSKDDKETVAVADESQVPEEVDSGPTKEVSEEASGPEVVSSEEADRIAASQVQAQDEHVLSTSEASTTFSIENSEAEEKDEEEDEEDPIVARLKKRIESMVDKIEVQLSDVQVKIGDKLHFLDKDRDGILSKEELAECLQQVLKRNITFDEAMEIAAEMDDNHDGFFTVDELIKWIDEHKLVKFVEEGRDADMDRMFENQATEQPKEEEATQSKS